ncbi:flagellar filament capping protein FliD [Neobacillus ginsengisoli]|uniref:Flagellar hook-associated protein 2 n=1 Tax=Neobacillus ginsengisoli TaxID=904295 RepID=A0ABT9XVN7_9BACI|nr:flagellar filament capping protein FliD [Neobacillus ginsengisoli]MDQ0199569.1 flagellar hook-associated protein 2 [Neobacillus ginsengisoli]
MVMNASSLPRLTGLATGMDTDSLVKKLMDAEKIPLNQLKQKQQKETWLSDSYRQWNSDLYSFKTTTLLNTKLSSTFNTFDVTSTQPSSVSGTAGGGAVAGTYNIAVKQLAQSASFTGNKVVLDPTKTLGDTAQGARQLTANTSISITVYNDPQNPSAAQTSAPIAINTTDTINDVITRINSATDSSGKSLGLQAMYDSNLQQFILKTKGTGTAARIDLSSNTDTLSQSFLSNTLGVGTNASVTGTAITNPVTIGSSNSLSIDLGGGISSNINLTQGTYSTPQSLVQEINNQIGKNLTLATKVSASLDATGKITLASGTTGTQSSITVNGNGTSSLGLNAPSTGTGTIGTLTASGQNADIIFNGNEINTLSSNNVTLMGINWTLKSPTVDVTGNPTTTSVNVSQNIDLEVKNIEDFISKYNDILNKLNSANNEPVYKDYQPLTDDQRSAMSDTQIQQWEIKAKSGLLHGDSIINGLINNLRNDMGSTVNTGSKYNSLASIGIASKSYQDKGKLYVDETKLRAAIQTDPDGVRNLFTQIGSTAAGTNGLLNHLSDDLQQGIQSLTVKAGIIGNSPYDQSVIGKLLGSIQTEINTQNDRLNQKETQYYNQFAAMETAVSKFNSQSSWLAQQLGMGGK